MYSLAKINESKKNLISNEYKNSMKIKQTNKSTEKLLKMCFELTHKLNLS